MIFQLSYNERVVSLLSASPILSKFVCLEMRLPSGCRKVILCFLTQYNTKAPTNILNSCEQNFRSK